MDNTAYALYRSDRRADTLIAVRRDPERAKQEAARLQKEESILITEILAKETDPFWIECYTRDPIRPSLEWEDNNNTSRAKNCNAITWLVKPYEL